MSNPSPDRDERVPERINLSLCNMCHAVSVGWNNCPHCGAEDWRNVGVYALVDNPTVNDAATRMRDRCVDRVKEYLRHAKNVDIAPLIDDLQALTLEQGEQEKRG